MQAAIHRWCTNLEMTFMIQMTSDNSHERFDVEVVGRKLICNVNWSMGCSNLSSRLILLGSCSHQYVLDAP